MKKEKAEDKETDISPFLFSAINDAQSIIRSLDTKANILLAMLLLPLTKLGSIFSVVKQLFSSSSQSSNYIFAIVVFMFCLFWLSGFLTTIKLLIAIDNPTKHIGGEKPTGVFFSGGLFLPGFLDAYANRQIWSTKQFGAFFNAVQLDSEGLRRELAYELMKVIYIRTIKMKRVHVAYYSGLLWILTGGILWLSYLIRK